MPVCKFERTRTSALSLTIASAVIPPEALIIFNPTALTQDFTRKAIDSAYDFSGPRSLQVKFVSFGRLDKDHLNPYWCKYLSWPRYRIMGTLFDILFASPYSISGSGRRHLTLLTRTKGGFPLSTSVISGFSSSIAQSTFTNLDTRRTLLRYP